MADDFYDGKFVSKMVNDPLMLRLILEALIVDDLDKKRKTLNLAEVMSEIQDNPEAVIQRANEEADHLLRLLKAIRLTFCMMTHCDIGIHCKYLSVENYTR